MENLNIDIELEDFTNQKENLLDCYIYWKIRK